LLFTTAQFALLFLPCVLLGFFLVARGSRTLAAFWLFAASVFFYGYWMPRFTALLLGSVAVNFLIGRRISVSSAAGIGRSTPRAWMIAGVVFNLALLGYFKYVNLFVDTLEALLGVPLHFARVILPIGISFFTFTQIAFLADAYQKGVREYKFAHYGLFVTYFPHLVAGPVLHHAQMMPQFELPSTYRFQPANFAAGCAILCLGLLKKVVVADGIGPYADAVFNAASTGSNPTFTEAWLGSLSYTFQLYFDFSGYSDMAIGLSWMLNVRLPFNFDSPYKALSITEFWRRWHMTLSAFLRDYLYIAMGGNRRGAVRRYVNLAVTMLLGGLWHGASWTFVFWGGLHGVYLGVNHAFRGATARWAQALQTSRAFALASWLLTFLAVVMAWVIFRAPTFESAGRVLHAMTSLPAWPGPAAANRLLWNAGLGLHTGVVACTVLAAICIFAPNTNAIGDKIRTLCARHSMCRSVLCGFAIAIAVFLIVVNESRDSVSAFIYFNF
jgi:alginate O-acetyltransferase complex protein AlgI